MILIYTDSARPFPQVIEPVETDDWPVQESVDQFYLTVGAIIKRGFKGLKLSLAGHGQKFSYSNYSYDKTSPEGQMFEWLMMLGSVGQPLPEGNEAIAILERTYLEHGLTLPKKGACK